jgi:GNAT superfamily N-acetyltransferase
MSGGEFEYKDLILADCDTLTRLHDRYLNSGDAIRAWLAEGLSAPGYCGVKALCGGEIVGVYAARPGIEFTCGHEELTEYILNRYGDRNYYTGDTLIVLPAYRRMGVGTALAAQLLRRLIRQGCDYMVAEEWLRPGDTVTQASRVLKHMGETEHVGVFPDFYARLGEFGLACPLCGTRCACGAQVNLIRIGRGAHVEKN